VRFALPRIDKLATGLEIGLARPAGPVLVILFLRDRVYWSTR